VNKAAARLYYTMRNMEGAVRHFEKAASEMETDYWACGMISACLKQLGDVEGTRRSAQRTLARTEKIIAQDPNNGSAMSFCITALALLGEAERAKDLTNRALLLDPENMNMRYNLACMMLLEVKDVDAALDLLEPLYKEVSRALFNWGQTDLDLDVIRGHPRYVAMVAGAEARLAAVEGGKQ
jgi:adenylate cyclase